MPVYRVVNKAHLRATIQEQKAIDAHGNVFTIYHNGVPKRYEEGALIEDLTPDELQAFPDRFELVEGMATPAQQTPALAPAPLAPTPQQAPEEPPKSSEEDAPRHASPRHR